MKSSGLLKSDFGALFFYFDNLILYNFYLAFYSLYYLSLF